jgi:hypothetical protein
VNPAAVEACNSIDDDCDGLIDDNTTFSIGTITGPGQQCVPSAVFGFATFSIPSQPGAISYAWVVPTGMTIYSGQGTNSILVTWTGVAVGNGINGPMTVGITNGCGVLETSSLAININYTAPVQPNSISGPGKVCPGDNATYSVASVARASAYNWVVPTGMSIINGQGTNIITVSILPNYTGGVMSVNASNVCGNGPVRTKSISLNTASAPAPITGQSSGICGAGSVTLSTAGSPSATAYAWSAPSGVTIQSGQGGNTVSLSISNNFASGVVTVTALNGCGAGSSRSLTIIGTPGLPSVITGPTAVCPGATGVNYEVNTVAGATSYQWTVPAAIGTINSGQGSKSIAVDFNVINSSGQAITVRSSNACGVGPTRALNGINLNSANCSTPRLATLEGLSEIEVYPNPATTNATLRFVAAKTGQYQLSLTDLSGRTVVKEAGDILIGTNNIDLDISHLASGIYYINLISEGEQQQIRLMIE